MQITDGSIISQGDGYERKDMFLTFNEDEKQQNEINKNNARLIFKPKYIVFRPDLLRVGLSINEALVYSFIDGYLRDNGDRFYFTNEQIGNIFGFGEQAISNIIKRLKDKKFIDTSYRLKANGGKIRFIRKLYSDYNVHYSPTITPVIDNNNKINNNKINSNNKLLLEQTQENTNLSLDSIVPLEEQTPPIAATPPLKKRKDIDELIDNIKGVCDMLGVAYDKTRDRMFAKHILDSKEFGEFCDKIGQDRIEFSINVLKASMKIKYFKGPCSGPMKIYQNYTDVYNQTITKHKSTVGVLPGLN